MNSLRMLTRFILGYMGAIQLNSALVNESQLGTRLNHAIGSNRRGEFGLLLSLLSADARDMAQFQTQSYKSTDLRAKFDLPAPQKLLSQLDVDETCVNNSHVYQQAGATAFRLANVLQEEALVIRRNQALEMEEVLANCELVTRHRFNGLSDSINVKSLHFAEQLQMQRQMSEFIAQA
ncbi:queD-like protein [Shewanella sairae]|uniref:QueD-like protein n=2 Tax=Shewanella sairae TaxID=190310 RepID=A0ABQ4PM28_9GAMM|nr:queD-like protein [Shewanella sairae]